MWLATMTAAEKVWRAYGKSKDASEAKLLQLWNDYDTKVGGFYYAKSIEELNDKYIVYTEECKEANSCWHFERGEYNYG